MFFINTLIIMKAHWINSNIFCQAIGVLLELTRFGGIRYHFIIYNNVSFVLHRLPLTQASCSSLTRRVKTSSPTTMDIQTVQSRAYLGLGSTRASDQKTTAICQMRTYIDMLPNDYLHIAWSKKLCTITARFWCEGYHIVYWPMTPLIIHMKYLCDKCYKSVMYSIVDVYCVKIHIW